MDDFFDRLKRLLFDPGRHSTRRVEDAPSQDLPGILTKHTRRTAVTVEDWDEAAKKYKAHMVYPVDSLGFLEPAVDSQVPMDANLVLVLVEKRLLLEEPGFLKHPHDEPSVSKDKFWKIRYIPDLPSAQTDPPAKPPSGLFNLKPSLQTLRADINNSASDFGPPDCPPNFTASLIVADLYAGDSHIDGKTILVLREFLRDVARLYMNLRGVILVGAFPDALVKRTWGLEKIPKSAVLSYRTDLVMADLNGCWEDLYHDSDDGFLLDDIIGAEVILNRTTRPRPTNREVGVQDGFDGAVFNKDAGCYQSTGLVFRSESNETGVYNLETPISLPDILVSRIDARSAARTLVKFNFYQSYWMPDPYLERHLLIEYFKRNHNYRVNEINHRGCSGISHGSTDGSSWQPVDLRAAFAESQAGYGDIAHEPAVVFSGYPACTKDNFRVWLDEATILRSMLLHGNFGELQLNGGDWKYPDFREYWERGRGRRGISLASFYWNTSCWGNAPAYSADKPYNAPMYGYGTVSECLLFLADGLAVISRGQQGDDWPGKHPDSNLQPSPPGGAFEITLRARRTFGETWRAIFEIDRNNPTLRWGANEGVRKCAYRWGINGDWTLRLNKLAP